MRSYLLISFYMEATVKVSVELCLEWDKRCCCATGFQIFAFVRCYKYRIALSVHNPSWPFSDQTTPPKALATFSQWPHQRATQKERNDRFFIIAQPLCFGGKSIIKTRLTAKITAVSSIVLEPTNFFPAPKGLLTSPASPWCNLLLISNPIAFWNWIYLTHSHSEWSLLPAKKKKKKGKRKKGEILCEIAWGSTRFWNRQVPLSVYH